MDATVHAAVASGAGSAGGNGVMVAVVLVKGVLRKRRLMRRRGRCSFVGPREVHAREQPGILRRGRVLRSELPCVVSELIVDSNLRMRRDVSGGAGQHKATATTTRTTRPHRGIAVRHLGAWKRFEGLCGCSRGRRQPRDNRGTVPHRCNASGSLVDKRRDVKLCHGDFGVVAAVLGKRIFVGF